MARVQSEALETSSRRSARGSIYTRSPTARASRTSPSLSPYLSSDKENQQQRTCNSTSMEPAAKRQRLDINQSSLVTEHQAARLQGNPDLQYYDPNQDIEERRVVRKGLRDLNREAADLRQEWLAPGSTGLKDAIVRADTLYQSVRQTSDATIDSRLLVTVGDLTYKKTQQIVLGDGAHGIDVDDFVSRCISFMNRALDQPGNTQQLGSQRRRRQTVHDHSEHEEGGLERGDALNWEWLGAKACFPSNSRPPVPGFLLGPLSLQKRARVQRHRREKLQRHGLVKPVEPDELRAADLQQAENMTLTAQCRKIQAQLFGLLHSGHARVTEEVTEEMDEAEMYKVAKKHNLCRDGGISLFHFAVNPHSFGQTIENLFYVSFLIKEGKVGVQVSEEDEGIPTLHRSSDVFNEASRPQQQRDGAEGGERHQAVFSLDFDTWKGLVDVFDIRHSLIPDRVGDGMSTQVGMNGWYA